MELLLLDTALKVHKRHLQGPLEAGHIPFVAVAAGLWQAARPVDGDCLRSRFVAPGFEFADFSFMDDAADQERVRHAWPELAGLF